MNYHDLFGTIAVLAFYAFIGYVLHQLSPKRPRPHIPSGLDREVFRGDGDVNGGLYNLNHPRGRAAYRAALPTREQLEAELATAKKPNRKRELKAMLSYLDERDFDENN